MTLFNTNSKNGIVLPTEEQLQQLSCASSYGKSLNKQSLTHELLDCAIKDAARFYDTLVELPFIFNYDWRVKSEQSIRLKYAKGLKSGLRFNTVFNDLIGLRIKVQEYPDSYPDYFRVVDMRNGKKNYDGYRAVHLYYKLDNFHYQVEIQLWSDADYTFNDWSHTYGYKTLDNNSLALLRERCDSGELKTREDFRKAVIGYETK